MKLAVPLRDDHQIDDHFGHCKFYGIFSISENNQIEKQEIIPSAQECGCKSGIAGTLAESGVQVMLAGGIGSGAVGVMNSFGIEVVRGCSGNAAEAVNSYLAGTLIDSGDTCQHHNHEHGHHHHSH